MNDRPATNDEMTALCRMWTPSSFIAYYEWLYADFKWTYPRHLVPVAMALCDSRIRKIMLIVGPGSGKSQALSIVYPSWLLGHDPTQTIIGVSGAENLAQGFMSAVMEIVAYNRVFHMTFPNVRPDKEAGWSNDKGAFVTGRRQGIPDSNFWSGGLTSKVLVGKHARTLILDDLHSDDNSRTPQQCEEVVRKYYNTILGRADPTGARFIMAGRRWHENDIYGQLQASEDWVVLRLPAERPGSQRLYHDVYVPDNLDCVFTDGWVHCFNGQAIQVRKDLPKPRPWTADFGLGT